MRRREALRAIGTAAAGIAGLSVSRVAGSPLHTGQDRPELLIRGGRVVNADGSREADVRIRGERIDEIGAGLAPGPDARVIDASGLRVIPGGIDPHTHLRGGFVDDITTGTAAAVAGGITAVGTFANPNRGESPLEAMKRWLADVEATAIGDVFLHASIWPPGPEASAAMPELAAIGQPSHKIFMTRSDFAEHRGALIESLEVAREAGVVTLMHCEDGQILAAALRRLREAGHTDLRTYYAKSRPVVSEVLATQEAAALCELTGAPVHIVHLSAERPLNVARSPATRGLPLSVETRPLYLYFTEEALRGPDGPLYVGQPPLRSASDVEVMWSGLADGRIDLLATDHAPWTREQKLDPELDVGRVRPGVSDLRFMLPVLYAEGVRKGRISEERFVELTSTAAARVFGLYPERGVVREGALADVTVLDPQLEHVVSADDDPSNSDYTPFEGWRVTGWPVVTVRRGEVVYEGWRVVGEPGSGRPAVRRPRE